MDPRSAPLITAVLLVTAADTPASLRASLAALAGQQREPDALLVLAEQDLDPELERALPEPSRPADADGEEPDRPTGSDEPTESDPPADPDRSTDPDPTPLPDLPVQVQRVPAPLTPALAAQHALAATEGPAQTDRAPWIWFVPACAAPGRRALQRLLAALAKNEDVAVAGCKQLRPRTPDVDPASADAADGLVDVGLTLTRSARIVTGVEAGEVDQGQTDWRTDVLAVALPGMLVDAAVLRELGGMDAVLPSPWAEIELCHRVWRSGRRVLVVPGARALADPRPADGREQRAGRILVREALLPWPLAVLHLILLPLLTLLRTAGSIIAHRPRRVAEEITGALRAAARAPGMILRSARAARRARIPRRRLGPLFLPRRQELRRGAEALWTSLIADDDRSRRIRRTTWGIAGTSHGAQDADYGRHTMWTLLVALGSTLATLVMLRPLLRGGELTGPGLLALPSDPQRTREAAWASWIPGGLGHAAPADPLIRLLGALPVPGDLLVEIIVLGALPVSALAAWWAAGALTRAVGARLALSAAWMLSPVLLASLGAGSWPLLLVHALLPLLALAVGRAIGLVHKRSQASVAAAGAAGLLLLVIGAVQPVLVLLVALALALLAPAVPGRRWRLLWVLVPSLALHAPYAPLYAGRPGLLLAVGALPEDGARLRWPTAAALAPLIGEDAARLLPLALPALVLLAALAAPFLPAAAGRVGRYGLVLAGAGLLLAALAGRVRLGVGEHGLITAPPQALLDACLLGLGIAAACTMDALARREVGMGRSRRGLTAGAALLAAVICLGSLGLWALALPSGITLTRTGTDPVPAAAADQGEAAARTRTLVLEPTESPESSGATEASEAARNPADGTAADAAVRARLVDLGGDGAIQHSTLVQARRAAAVREGALAPDAAESALLGAAAHLLGTGGPPDAEALRTLAVGYIVVPGDPSTTTALTSALDSSPLLEKVTQTSSGGLWRVIDQQPRAAIVSGTGQDPLLLPSSLIDAEGTVRADPAERTVRLAERYDGRWRARLEKDDGTELILEPARADGWAQSFELPAGAAGHLVIERDDPLRLPAQILVLVAVVLTALVAVPWRGAAVRPESRDPDGIQELR